MERSDLRVEACGVLIDVASKNFQIGRCSKRQHRIGRALARMRAAIERFRIEMRGKVMTACREIGAIPDEVIDMHA